MISRALASASLAARHQASFMSLAFTQTTAPTLWRPAVTSASRSLRARPPRPPAATVGWQQQIGDDCRALARHDPRHHEDAVWLGVKACVWRPRKRRPLAARLRRHAGHQIIALVRRGSWSMLLKTQIPRARRHGGGCRRAWPPVSTAPPAPTPRPSGRSDIHWPERSATADRFFSTVSQRVSKRPIWLGEPAQP